MASFDDPFLGGLKDVVGCAALKHKTPASYDHHGNAASERPHLNKSANRGKQKEPEVG
jgi:hypothetical protein